MNGLTIRDISQTPKELRTDRENYLVEVYVSARDNVSGSMSKLCDMLEIGREEFYASLDGDEEFKNAILQGMSDGRSARLLELESALIELALGSTVTINEKFINRDGEEVTKRTERKNAPNFQALSLLLEKAQGSTWNVAREVTIDSGRVAQEIDYSLLTREQLKQLSDVIE